MFYGYETESGRGHVLAIWTERPSRQELGTLALLEVDHPDAPTEGNWRVSRGMLVERPGSREDYEHRRARVVRRRDKRSVAALVARRPDRRPRNR